jgi:hypothetical protein
MAQNIIIDIQVNDGRAQAKIRGTEDAFRDLTDVIKQAREQLSENNKVLTGSVQYYDKQIKELKRFRDQTAKTGLEYRKQTTEINKLVAAQKAISGPVRGSVADLQAQRNALIQQQKTLATTSDEYNKYQKRIIEVQNKIDVLSNATTKNVKVNQDLISNSGLAGATLTEVGRTISDLPYGIRGVTNNLSQLSTLFVTLISKTDGAKNAFALLGKQLNGPLGIILAFQAVIAAIDFFFGSTKKAEEAVDDLTDSLDVQVYALGLLKDRLDDVNLSLEARLSLVNAAAVTSTKLNKILEDENLTEAERVKRSEEFIALEIQRLKLQAQRTKLEEKLSETIKKQEEAETVLAEAQERKNNGLNDYLVSGSGVKNVNEAIAQATKDLADANSELESTDLSLISVMMASSKVIADQNKLLSSNTKEREKAQKIRLEAIEFEGLKFYEVRNQLEQKLAKIQSDRRKIEIQGVRTILAENIAALKEEGHSREVFESKKLSLISDALEREIKAIEFALEYDKLTVQERLKLREQLALLQLQLSDIEDQKLKELLGRIKKVVSEVTSLMADFNNAELSAAERNTVLINNQLKERLKNEKLSAKERERINAQIAANEEKLQKKRDEIAKRNFRLQKAFAVAQSLINTYSAVAEALPNIPKAIAVGVLGAAQVAAILATKFVPSASSVPSGSAGVGATGAPDRQDPTFNIVGTGQQFQLSQAIAQRTGEPVKAYVVTGDVRSGLALERNIIKGSKLG